MDKPWLLDLFAGAGGAGEGYRRAGFHVVSVDIAPQKHNPHEFYQDDALAVLDTLLARGEWNGYHLHDFDAIHASPPCQDASSLHARYPTREYLKLIEPTRERLLRTGQPWVIENVMPARLLYGVTLCGGMFGLRTYRHRRFETSWLCFQPGHPPHIARTATKRRRDAWAAGWNVSVTGDVGTYLAAEAMGIDWMNGDELSQAIPPAYTQWIGAQLLIVIGAGDRARRVSA
jgi:DNA (cytosine-5)-methyltransferase 1